MNSSTRSAQPPSISSPRISRAPSTLRAAWSSEGEPARAVSVATAAAATVRTSPATSLPSTPSLTEVASWRTTGSDSGGGAGSETVVAGVAVVDAVASLLLRRQRSKSTTARAARAKIRIATQIGKPGE